MSWSPRLFRFRDLLSVEECIHLVAMARPFLRPAMVLSRETGDRVHDPARRSHNARLINPLRDTVICNIEARLAALSLLPAENSMPTSSAAFKASPGHAAGL